MRRPPPARKHPPARLTRDLGTLLAWFAAIFVVRSFGFFPSFLTRTLPEERSNGTISVSSL